MQQRIKLMLIVLLTALPLAGWCQQDTAFFDYTGGQKPSRINAYKYWIFHRQTGLPCKGEEYFVKNNELRSTGYYSSIDPVIKNGQFICYDSGRVSEEGKYERNKKNGEWKYYRHDAHIIWYTENYEDGDLRELSSYYKSGKLKRHESYQKKDTTATGKCYDEKGKEIPFTRFRTLSKSGYSLPEYLSNNLHYPIAAREDGIEGKVIIKFTVAIDGSIGKLEVVKSVGGGCDEEALRVVAKMPKWEPGIVDDEVSEIFFNLPVMFKLE